MNKRNSFSPSPPLPLSSSSLRVSEERSTGARHPLWVKETVDLSLKVASDRIYYLCVLRVKDRQVNGAMREPDEERGCGPDDYDIGEGVIPYPAQGEYNITSAHLTGHLKVRSRIGVI